MKILESNFTRYVFPFLLSTILFVISYHRLISIPRVDELETLSGTIEAVWFSSGKGKKSKFKINGIDKYFEYLDYSGERENFRKHALVGKTIELSYSPNKLRSQIFYDGDSHVVYSVSFLDKWNQGYEDITRNQKNYTLIGFCLALLFFIIPFVLYFKSKKPNKAMNRMVCK